MAEGLIILLTGDDCTHQRLWQGMRKTYTFNLVLGIRTDSYDTFGKVMSAKNLNYSKELDSLVNSSLNRLEGTWNQTYPPFSSISARNRTGFGQALWKWASQGRMDEVEHIPFKPVTVHSINRTGLQSVSIAEIVKLVSKDCSLLRNATTFRVPAIIRSWKGVCKDLGEDTLLPILSLRADVSSGTYIRGLSHRIGEELYCGAIAMDIVREVIGPYGISHLTKSCL
eukprot:CAMPEP_0167750064 /NCGR_PEP_ID=MMETSP0110_2-20121227/5775_1 /TAXON_ID=629695 /ORGANISM="Gymnochlora sp., Strain CCMP2014" /LENGTH=225 /DNA_ID=CAMNT_0007635327 /DNA_START=510 /DNA_END=1184 /DNA_ORIENTATION=+